MRTMPWASEERPSPIFGGANSCNTPGCAGWLVIATYFDAVISVEEVGVFKPHPSVYALGPQRLDIPKERICFLSCNGWDACSAKAFGFNVLWCNRFGQPPERMPATPDGEITSRVVLPDLIRS